MQRRVQQPDYHRLARHDPQDAPEVVGLEQLHPVQGLVKVHHRRRYVRNLRVHKGIGQRVNVAVAVFPPPFLRRLRVQQHLAHGGQAVGVEEHMLRPA